MSKKKSHYSKAGLVFEELEPRLLLSADPLAVATDASVATVQELVVDNNEDQTAVVQTSVEQAAVSVRNELVIIDSRAPNYQQLHNDLIKAQLDGRNIHVVVLDAHRDGIEQINEALISFNKLDAVHIVSHGDEGQLQLGATQLNKTSLYERKAEISNWKETFTDGGDLLIYGCNLAGTPNGKSFVDSLSQITATDVAASNDLTGNKLLGGDWELEYTFGDVDTQIAFSEHLQQQWDGTLADVVHESNETSTGDNGEIKADQSFAQEFAHDSSDATYEVNEIEVKMYRENDPAADNQTISVSLRDSWNGTILGSATLSSNDLALTETWENFDIGSVFLNDNQSYVIQIDSDSTNGKVHLALDGTSSYGAGDLLKNGSPEGKDGVFRLIQNTPPVSQDDSYTVDAGTTLNSADEWFNTNWQFRKALSFDNLAQTENLTDFPVLVKLDSTRIDYSNTQDQGQDLRFTDSDGSLLSYEIESWNEAGESYVWVKIPQIDATSGNDYIYMYYGNAAAPDGQNPDGVWSEGYRAVYHLDETGTTFDDSTARDLDGSVSTGTTSVNGLIGGARDFEETNADSIDLGTDQNYLKATSVGTLSAWINPETLSGDGAIVGVAVSGATPQSSSRFSILASGDNIRVYARSTDSTAAEVDIVTNTSPLTAGSWHYVSAVVDYANNSVDVYVDGVLQTITGTVSFASGTTPNTASSATAIGANEDKANELFDGIIDEVHIAHAARSADWIKAEYESQKDQFVTFGYQQSVSGVLGNDLDQESDLLSASLVSDVTNGALVLNADGTFQYTPDAGFGGTDSFVYEVNDGSNNASQSTVYITVNDAPIANNDSYSIGQDQTLTITSTSTAKSTATDLEALWNFNDGVTDTTGNGNDGATYGDMTWVTSSRTGEAALSFDGVDDYVETTSATLDLSTATSFTLSAWFQTDTTAGQHHILWQGVSTENGWGTPADESPTSSEMHLSIGHWDAAVNNKITFFMGYHDLGPASINIISDSDFTDTGGWHNALVVVSDLGGGKLQAELYIDGVLEGSDTGMEIDRSLWDTGFRIGQGGPAGRNFDGMIDEVAVYNRDLTSSEVHEIYTAGIIANDSDADGDFLTASLVTGPVSGSLSLQEDGSFTYTPNAGFSGTDTFTYKVNDGSLDSNIATVTIDVINNAPLATDDPGEFNTSVSSYNPLSYWRLGESGGTSANDDGVTGNTATYNGVTIGQTGAISGDGDTSISFDGTDDYVEIAHDDAYLIDDGTVQLWFKADDLLTEQGIFSKDSNSFDTGGHFTIRLKTDGSVEVRLQSTTDSYYVSSLPGSVTAGGWHHVAVNFGSDGMELFLDGVSVDTNPYTGGLGTSSGGIGNYEPIAIGANTWQTGDQNLTGMNQFFGGSIDEVAIIDQALTAEQIQTIYASAVQNYTVAENSSLVIPAAEGVLVNDLDAENDVLTASLVSDVSYGILALNADGSFTYTPDAEFSGTDTFTYVANDGNNDSNVATVTITVTGDNDAPVNTIPATQVVLEDTQTSISGISVTDPDAGPGIIDTRLSVSNGVLDVTLAGAATISAGANGSNSLTISGTVDDINATLSSLKYTGDANLYGIAADTLTVVTNDLGNTGTGGAQSDTDTVQINITAVNDAPVLDLDADDSSTSTGANYQTSFIEGNGAVNITDTDVFLNDIDDTNLVSITVTLTNYEESPPNKEVLSATASGGVSAVWDGGTNTLTISGTGTVAEYLAVLSTVNYNNTQPNPNAADRIITFVANDGTDTSVIATTTVSIVQTSKAPVANNDAFTVDEGSTNTLNIAGNDIDQDGDIDTGSITIVSGPTNGTITAINADGTVEYQHNGSETLSDSFSYTIDDLIGATSNVATVSLTINPVNDAPVAADTPINASEDTVFNGNLPAASDAEGEAITYALGTAASNGTAVVNADGSFSYTPNSNYNGGDSFSYTVSDPNGDSNTYIVTVNVTSINDAPVADDETGLVTVEDTLLNIDVLAGDTDAEGDPLSVTGINGMAIAVGGTVAITNGSVTLLADGSLDFTPAANYNGPVNFSYTVSDGSLTDSGNVAITVTAVNDAPVAADTTINATEDTVFNGNLPAASDAEGEAITYALGTAASNGTVVVNADGSFSYTPNSDYNGTDSFSYTVSDPNSDSNAYNVTVNVAAVSDPAAIGGVDSGIVTEDVDPDLDNLLEVSGALTIIDPDAGEAVFNTGVFGGVYGVITLNAAGGWDYAANTNQAAIQGLTAGDTLTDTITVSSVDGTTHDIVITIMGTNDAPVAGNDVANVNEGGSIIIDVAATDSDIDNTLDLSSITITSLPANGAVIVNGDGTVTYTHNGSETLTDAFSYSITDISGAVSNIATVTLNVNPVNDSPLAGDDAAILAEGGSVLIDLAANDIDVDNALDLNSISIIAAPANGTLAVNGDGTVTYNHDGSNTLSDSFTYTISDISGAISNTATVNLAITPVNDTPTTSGISNITVSEDAVPTTIDLNTVFDDSDNLDSELGYTITGNSNIGLFSAAGIDGATGQLTLNYAADMNGTAQISIRATDPAGLSVDTLFTVTVSPVNDVPVMQSNSGMLATGTVPTTITSSQLSASDIDNASSEIIYTVTTMPANGSLLLNGVAMSVNDTFTQADLDNNLVVYQSAGTDISDQFGFIVADMSGGTIASDTFDIVVQVRQDIDEDTPEKIVSTDDNDAEDEVVKDEGVTTETGDLVEAAGEFGGGFEPFGSSSTPPAPAPVLSIDPKPVPEAEERPQPSQPVEEDEVIVAEVEEYTAQTFTAVQMKSMDALWVAIDNMKQEMADAAEENSSAAEFKVAAAKSSGVVLTAGVVAWILRSGALLSSLLSTIPLWKGYDPLPILAYKDDEDEKEDEIDEDKIPTSLEEMRKLKKLKDKKVKEIDVDEIFGGSGTRE